MRLVALLAIITTLAGCPLAIEVPDASLPDIEQNVAGRGAEGANRASSNSADSNTAAPIAGSGGDARPYGGTGGSAAYDGGVPFLPDGGIGQPGAPNMLDPRMAPAHIQLLLTDEPAPQIQAVWVDVTGVEAHAWIAGVEQWLRLPGMPLHVDLLTLRDGKTALLSDAMVPPGKYDRLRVHLAREASAVVDGVAHPLPVAPELGDQGVVVDFGVDIQGGVTYKVVIDFDVLSSIQQREQGPVLAPFIHVKEVSQPMQDDDMKLPAPPAPDGGSEAEPSEGS